VPVVTDRPLGLLHAIAGPEATFRTGQLEAIDAVVAERRGVLLVQRTGWKRRPALAGRKCERISTGVSTSGE
jgi:hypothetical protein